MAIAPLQTKVASVTGNAGYSDSLTVGLDTLPGVGSSVTVNAVLFHGDGNPVASITDTHSNVWTFQGFSLPAIMGQNWLIGTWLCSDVKIKVIAPFSVTITPAREAMMTACVREYPGILTRVGSASTGIGNTSPIVTALTTTATDVLLESTVTSQANGAGITVPGGWTGSVKNDWVPAGFAYSNSVGAGSKSVAWALTTAVIELAALVCYTYTTSSDPGTGTGDGDGGSTSANPLVPRSGSLRKHQAEYKRVRGGIRQRVDSLLELMMRSTNKCYFGFVAEASGFIDEFLGYWSAGSGYAAGTGGVINATLYEQLANGRPNKAISPFATFTRIPANLGMVGGNYVGSGNSFTPDAVASTKPVVAGTRYVWEIVNSDASPSVNWSTLDLGWTAVSNSRPIPWIEPLDWWCGIDMGGVFTNWTSTGGSGGISLCMPIMQYRISGRNYGASMMETGNAFGRWRDHSHPIASRYTGSISEIRISGLTFNTSKVSGSGGFNARIVNIADGAQIGPVLTVSDPGNNATTAVINGNTLALHATYDVAFPQAVVIPPGVFFDIQMIPQGSSVWRNASQRTGSYYGFSADAAVTECHARYYDGSAWQIQNFWNNAAPGTLTDQVWRHGFYIEGDAVAPQVTITGFGELPTDYPITSVSIEGLTNSLAAGVSVTVTLRDQNGVPLIGATPEINPIGYLVPVGSQSDASGQITLNVPAGRSGNGTFTARYTNSSGEVLTAVADFRIGGSAVNAPTISATATSSTSIEVTINDQSTDETGFELQRALSATGPWQTITAAIPARVGTGPFVVGQAGLSGGTTYYFQVRALGATPSEWSNRAPATTPPVVVDNAPTIVLSVTPVSLTAAGSVVLRATVTDTQRVQFYRNGTAIGQPVLAPFQTSINFSTPNDNGTHTFTARATSETGRTTESNAVGVSVQIPIAIALNAPSNLRVTSRSDRIISIEWDLNSANEEAVLVEMSTSGGAFVEVASLPAGSRTYIADSLLSSTRYGFRVRVRGSGSVSGYATAVYADTFAPPVTGLAAVRPKERMVSAPPGGTYQLVYEATDGNGSGRPGVSVTISVDDPAFVTATQLTALTDALGRAVFELRFLDVGQTQILATATDGSSSLSNIEVVGAFTLPEFTEEMLDRIARGEDILDPRYSWERFPYLFSFSSDTIGMPASKESIVGVPVVEVYPIGGAEIDPDSAAMIFGQPIVRGNRVLQFFTGGRPGITYVIRCLATTSTGRRVIDEMRIRIYANEGRRARRL